MIKKIWIAAVLVLATALLGALPLKTFNSEDPISSSDVNANFASLEARIAALETKPVSLAANGYLDLQGGLTLQWGTATGVAVQGSTTITFPKAFANGLLFASATTGNGTSTNCVNDWSITGSSSTSVTFLRANWSSENNATSFMWFAVGY
jgi:hypothetical protein